MYRKIGDYGVIGDLRSAALVGPDGAVDWLCLPYIDSPSVFCALLDDKKGGIFRIGPAGEFDSCSHYIERSNVLTTVFRDSKGTGRLLDFMPVPYGGEEEREEYPSELVRIFEVTRGAMQLAFEFEPAFDYARAEASFERIDENTFRVSGGGTTVVLAAGRELPDPVQGRISASWSLAEGKSVCVRLTHGDRPGPFGPDRAGEQLRDTLSYWNDWLKTSETGRTSDFGEFSDMMERSALALKLLYFGRTGTIAAAATTSLPEEVGGVRNWDYRFTWIRDSAFTLKALFNLGHLSEMEGYLGWVDGVVEGSGAEELQIMYRLRDGEDLTEQELDHLDGYKGSRPVRIGNGAARQTQLDIYGELMDFALTLSDYAGKIRPEHWPSLRNICDTAVKRWREKDYGIWEVRGGPYHFVHSKVMCWVALDRGLKIADRYGFEADKKLWRSEMDHVRADIIEKGYNSEKGAFRQHYETDATDASSLLIPMTGFLKHEDPMAVSNLEAVERELARDGLVYRYRADDGLEGGEGAFLICSFWLADNLIALGRLDEARRLIRKLEGFASPLGIFSEEYDPAFRELLGNFPQAFTHIGYVNSVSELMRAGKEAGKSKVTESKKRPWTEILFSPSITLNEGKPDERLGAVEASERLRKAMNVLRGAYFDTANGRIAYERMAGSGAYREYVKASVCLRAIDLGGLETNEEKLSFWVNVYNALVMHGVIELGVRDTVKEVRNFFRRVTYDIGGHMFGPDDVEHGVLRANATPPNSLFRRFSDNDPRLRYAVRKVDPRIHFALVCGSSSCPPIEVYTPERIGEQLDISARTFINAGGAVIDAGRGTIGLSRIFKWYAPDFGDEQDILKLVAGYLYDEEAKRVVLDDPDRLDVYYLDYDWRLNRTD